MRLFSQRNLFAARKDFVAAVLLVPFGHGRVLVHVFDDIAPTDSGIVRAETNLTFLRAVGNDAHFGAPKVVVEKILEPHPGDKQEVPAIRATLLDIFLAAVAADLSIVLASQSERLIELFEKLIQIKG